jgi:hypothetical protein
MDVPDTFWMMHDIIHNYYKAIILEDEINDIPDYSDCISEKSIERIKVIIYQLKDIMKICKSKDINIKYTGILCRRHLKLVNKQFDLGYDDMSLLYIQMSVCVILEKHNIKRLVYIKCLYDFMDYIDVFTTNETLVCKTCKEKLELIRPNNKRILSKQLSLCTQCNDIFCKTCIQKHFE